MPLLNNLHLYLLQAHGDAAHHAPAAVGSLEWFKETNLINIAIAAFLVYLLIQKINLGGKIEQSQTNLSEEIKALESERAAAEAKLAELRKKTENVNAEVDAIIAAARQSAESLSKTIISDAHTQAAKVIDAAKSRIELEQRSAARDLERRLLNDALNDAREDLARNLTPDDQKRSVDAFLNDMAQLKGRS